ncbi:MAG: MFS transporter, partial [Alphaproteobacteria bacterium]
IWLVGIYGTLMYIPLSGFAELWAVPYIMETYNVNNEVASIASIMVLLGMGLGCPLSAWLSDYLQSRRKVMSWAALGTMLFFLIAIYIPGIPLNGMFVLLFIGGLFCGGQILYFAVAKEQSPSHASGTAIGFTNGVLMSSGFIAQPLLGLFLDLVWDGQMTATGVRYYSAAVYQTAMTAIPAALFLAWVIMLFVKETYPKVSHVR